MARAKRSVIEYRNYEITPQQPILVLTGERWYISPVPSNRLHFHNCLQIGCCHEGSGTMIFPGGPQEFRAGDVTIVSMNVPHTTYSAPGTRSLWSYLYLVPQMLYGGSWCEDWPIEQRPQARLRSRYMIIHHDEDRTLLPLIQSVLHEYNEKKPGGPAVMQAVCVQLIIQILRIATEYAQLEQRTDHWQMAIAPALDYIRQHYNQSFPLDSLAELCHLSPTHFRRLFHEETGTSPSAFLTQTRILQSCSLLQISGLSISEIAGRVGFTTLSSFNRHFAAMMDCSPRTWRQKAEIPQRHTVLSYAGWTEAEQDVNQDAAPE